MQKKKQPSRTKQIIIFIAIVTIVLLITFAEDIIKLANKNKLALQENNPNETTPAEPNPPHIVAGMIPVKWDGENWIITTREDPYWYDYKTGKLAYVMLNDGYYRSEIERGVEPDQLMENNVGESITNPEDLGTIFAWMPRFAYNENGDIQYIKDIEQADETWTIPDIFTHKQVAETSPDFLLTGIWFEIDVDNTYLTKIKEMNTKDSIYGFIANTKALASDQTTGNTIQTYYNTMIANTVGAPLVGIPEGIDTAVPLTITDIANPNRIILHIINQKNQDPIKAKASYNKDTGLITVQVTYSQYGISKILYEDTSELKLEKNGRQAQATSEGIDVEDGERTITIIDNNGNEKKIKVKVVSRIYATLYKDGTLAFGKSENPIPEKTIWVKYGDIADKDYYQTNTPWYNHGSSVTTVEFVNKISPISTANWFYYCNNLTNIINIENLNTSNVTNMHYMFYNCSVLTTLDLRTFDTSNVTNMASMFMECKKLTQLDLSSFDTSNVTNMNQMFYQCSGLTQLDLSNFDTSNVTNMKQMFYHCSGLTQLDVSNFDTSKVTDINGMFYYCSGLTQLDVSNFNTSKVTDMGWIFCGCKGLTDLDVSNFDTTNVTNMKLMFSSCSGLTELDVSSFNTSNVTNMYGIFNYSESLTALDLSNFDTSNVTDMSWMFRGCRNLKTIYVGENWTTDNATITDMFYRCGTSTVTQK